MGVRRHLVVRPFIDIVSQKPLSELTPKFGDRYLSIYLQTIFFCFSKLKFYIYIYFVFVNTGLYGRKNFKHLLWQYASDSLLKKSCILLRRVSTKELGFFCCCCIFFIFFSFLLTWDHVGVKYQTTSLKEHIRFSSQYSWTLLGRVSTKFVERIVKFEILNVWIGKFFWFYFILETNGYTAKWTLKFRPNG